MKMTCHLCDTEIDGLEFLDHFAQEHAMRLVPERWPDGEVVVIDSTLTPDHFKGNA